MVKERRFRGFTLAHVEQIEAREDGTIAMIGLSGSGDAVAMIVQPEAIDDLVSRLQDVRSGRSRSEPFDDPRGTSGEMPVDILPADPDRGAV